MILLRPEVSQAEDSDVFGKLARPRYGFQMFDFARGIHEVEGTIPEKVEVFHREGGVD